MKKKLYIFDLDGTILDTLEDLAISVNYALAVFDFPPLSNKEIADRTGNGVQRLVELSVPSTADRKTTLAVLDVFKQHYFYHCADHTRPYDDIKDVICEIRRQGAKCAVVSNKMDSAVQELAKDYFEGLFDFVSGQKDGVRKKPYPDTVLLALKTLGVNKKDALYIGDSEVDIATAKNADMECLSVDWGFRDRQVLVESGATQIISKPKDILKF